MTDPTSLPNFPPPADEHPLRGRVLDALQDGGFAPDIDADGDVSFKVADQQLFVRCTEGEVALMRVFGQWALAPEVPQELTRQLEVCNEINLSLNLAKTGMANNTLVVTCEHLAPEGAPLEMLLDVSIQIILAGVQMWHERILGLEPGGLAQGQQPDAPQG